MSGDSSSSTFHRFQEFIIFNYQKSRNSEFQKFKNGQLRFPKSKNQELLTSKIQKWATNVSETKTTRTLNFKNKNWTAKVSELSKLLSFRFPQKYVSQMFPDFVLICFQVIRCNKMKKYGLTGPKTSIIHEMLSFPCLMPWNRHDISSICRRKIQLSH